jgi:hypothetical protein
MPPCVVPFSGLAFNSPMAAMADLLSALKIALQAVNLFPRKTNLAKG